MADGSVTTTRDARGRPIKYHARWRDEKGTHRSRTFQEGELDLAQRFVDHVRSESVTSDLNSVRDVTFGWFAENKWLPGSFTDREPPTQATWESVFRTHLMPAFSGSKLRHIRPADIEAFLRLKRSDYATATLKLMRTVLSSVLVDAWKHEYIESNPLHAVRTPRGMGGRKDNAVDPRQVLEPETVRLIADASADHARSLILTLGFTGIRISEACALTVGDYCRKSGRLTINKAMSRAPARLAATGRAREIKDTKSRASTRTIRITPDVAEVIEQQCEGRGADEWLFLSKRGCPVSPNNFTKREWKQACAAVGVKGYTVHDLRHTTASMMIKRGINTAAIAAYLGHSSPAVTLKFYAGFFASDDDDIMAALGGYLA